MCGRVVSEDSFSIRYVPDQYKIQNMCDKAINDSLAALKLIPDWFVTIKMIQELFTALNADENILYFNEDSDNVIFSCNEMGILNINLKNIRLIIILTKMILTLLFISDCWLGISNLKNAKHLKKR